MIEQSGIVCVCVCERPTVTVSEQPPMSTMTFAASSTTTTTTTSTTTTNGRSMYPGVTEPVSLAGPDEKSLKASAALEKTLRDFGLFEPGK